MVRWEGGETDRHDHRLETGWGPVGNEELLGWTQGEGEGEGEGEEEQEDGYGNYYTWQIEYRGKSTIKADRAANLVGHTMVREV